MAPINARVVRRSLVLQNQHQNTYYSECASIGMWIRIFVMWINSGFGYFKGEPIKSSNQPLVKVHHPGYSVMEVSRLKLLQDQMGN